MKSSVQFLTTPTVDTNGTALLLSFADRRYLIGNIHEGTQRACIQRGVRVAKVSDIFLTGKTEWKNTGGLIGMILNIADTTQSAAAAIHHAEKERLEKKAQRLSQMHPKERAKQSKVESLHPKPPEKHSITIHGGPNITHTLATARRFVFRKGMPVDVNEFRETEGERDWEPTWSDQRIQVWAMSIEPSSSHGPTRPASPQSSRKRSFDEYRENRQHDEKIISKEKADRNQQLRRAVVCDMFDSDWRLDALIEVPIAQVHMPATLFVRNPDTKKIENYSGPIPGSKEPLPDLNVLVRRPWPGALVAELPPTKPSEVSLSYIIRNHRQRGKFLPDKAKALNIETRSFSQLVEGRSVVSKDGITILPEQVLEKDKSGTGFAIIELPSRDYVQNLVNRPEWRVDKIMEGVEMFIWILGPGVGQDQTLMKFMTDFSHMKHIVSSQDECPNILSLDSSAAAAIRRNQMDPDRYPVPIHHNSLPQREERNPDSTSHPHSIVASRGLMIDLEPRLLIKEETSIRPLNTAEVLKDTDKDIIVHAKAIRQDIASEKFQTEMKQQNLPSPEAEMIFLGTGSALPSKYRNVSATLLRVPGSGSYLLDCGENTLGQLSRVYTSEELLEVFQDLKMIWISHLHADHHLGTTSVIKAWYQAVYGKDYSSLEVADTTLQDQFSNPAKIISEQKRLFVASDHSMIQWLKEYASVEDFGYDKIIPLNVTGARLHNPDSTELDWNRMPLTFKPSGTEISAAMRAATGLTNFAATNVLHCHGAKAVSLTFPTGFKFSYSGDCRPSNAFAEIGHGSTVLLHEATFDDELSGDAKAKRHSTISEAIGVGIAMRAPRVMLTHFSQRYQKIPNMDGMEGREVELTLEGESDDENPTGRMNTAAADIDNNPSLSEMVESDSALEDILGNELPTVHRRIMSRRGSGSSSKSSQQRIRKVAITRHQPQMQDMKVGVAFDYMRVKVKDIALLEKFTPVFLRLYEDEVDTGEKEEIDERAEVSKEKKNDKAGEKNKRSQQNEKSEHDARNENASLDQGDGEIRQFSNTA